MSRRRMLLNTIDLISNDWEGGEIALFDTQLNKEILVNPDNYNTTTYSNSRYVPVGVVAIPQIYTTTIYPKNHYCYNKPVICSLLYMNYETPDSGNIDECSMNPDANVSKEVKLDLPFLNNSTSSLKYIVSDANSRLESEQLPGFYYSTATSSYLVASPIIYTNGIYKINQALVDYGTDFDGYYNTSVTIDSYTDNSWKLSQGDTVQTKISNLDQCSHESLNGEWNHVASSEYQVNCKDIVSDSIVNHKVRINFTTYKDCTVNLLTYVSYQTASFDYSGFMGDIYIGKIDESCSDFKYSKRKIVTDYTEESNLFTQIDVSSGTHFVEFLLVGKVNKDIYISASVSSYSYQTETSTPLDYRSGYKCCWRYHTIADQQGDWYLPAIGELSILYLFYNRINNSLKLLGYVDKFTNLISSTARNQAFSYYMINTNFLLTSSSSSNIKAFRPLKI